MTKIRFSILLVCAGIRLFAQDGPAGFPRIPGAQAGAMEVNPMDDLPYVWIPPGKFDMGCSAGDNECEVGERPAHQVTIGRGFWMGQTPVTQAAYQRVTGRSPGYFMGEKFPVESVTWEDAQGYCEVTGTRLPTEEEWEYAARAGTSVNRYGELDQIAWYGVNSGNRTHDVMQKQPNAWKLYDMLGDVWQWVGDWLSPYPDGKLVDSPSAGATGLATGKLRALRGGSWANGPGFVRASVRSGNEQDHRSNVVGFRCVGN